MKGEWCKHYNGLTHEECRAGIPYATVEADERDEQNYRRFPCFQGDGCADLCACVEYPTPDEVAERNRHVAATFTKYLSDIEAGKCPFCGSPIERERQVGRCVYADPCGHRLYQGKAKAFTNKTTSKGNTNAK